MNQLTPYAVEPAPDGWNDDRLIQLWLSLKVSSHTQRAYLAEGRRFLEFAGKPLSRVTLADVQAYAEELGQGSLVVATQNRALTAIKSLLSFGHETGYLPFNVGIVVKLRSQRDSLAQRILEESEIAKLMLSIPAAGSRNRGRKLRQRGPEYWAHRWHSEYRSVALEDLRTRRKASPSVAGRVLQFREPYEFWCSGDGPGIAELRTGA